MRLFFSLFLCFNCWFQLLAQTQKAEELRSNVVSISAQGQYGFGFITGEHNRKLFIATAAHVVEYALDGAQMVDLKFYNDYNSYKGKILRSYADVDVALIEVDKPTGFAWKANCLGVATASADAAFVGRDREWYVPAGRALGTIYSLGNNQLQVDITSIPVGTSGSPLIVESGIVGMILSTDGIKATALDLNQLRAVLSEYNYFFELTGDGFTSSSSGPTDIDTEAIYKDIRAYKAAEEKDDISAYQVYLRDYPSGEFRDKAIERIQALEQEKALRQEDAKWEVAKVRNDVKGYQAYLDLFPNGRYQSEAKRRINQLKQQSLSANQKEITIKDRDGNTYYTKVMKDGKRWMTKNMNVEVDNSWCYDNQTTNCDKYGRLYTYEAAKEACSSLGALVGDCQRMENGKL